MCVDLRMTQMERRFLRDVKEISRPFDARNRIGGIGPPSLISPNVSKRDRTLRGDARLVR